MRSDGAGAACPGPRAIQISEAAVQRPAVAGTQQAAATRTGLRAAKGLTSGPVVFLAEPLVEPPVVWLAMGDQPAPERRRDFAVGPLAVGPLKERLVSPAEGTSASGGCSWYSRARSGADSPHREGARARARSHFERERILSPLDLRTWW